MPLLQPGIILVARSDTLLTTPRSFAEGSRDREPLYDWRQPPSTWIIYARPEKGNR